MAVDQAVPTIGQGTAPDRPAAPVQPGPSSRPGVTRDTTRAILGLLFGQPSSRPFGVRFWDGTFEGPLAPAFTITLQHPGALRRMLFPPSHLALGEAFLRGDFDVEGDLASAAGLYPSLAERLTSPSTLARLLPLLRTLASDTLTRPVREPRPFRRWWREHTRRHDAAAVRYHYDVGNDFYALWLDRRMVYTCAYFPNGDESLEQAQEAKLEHICRKLRLRPGERLLDIGCGWGGLLLYAAERYGVHATGITLSPAQASLARERIAAAGLSDRCHVVICDYRDLAPTAQFDKVVSVGMYEQVGKAKLPAYFKQAYRLTRPGGLFLFHGITLTQQGLPQGWVGQLRRLLLRERDFIQRYTFPGGYLATLAEVVGLAERTGFEMRDVESLREHYARTLRHWVRRLEARHDDAVAIAGETTYRIWRLYMAFCAYEFGAGTQSIVQCLFARQGDGGQVSLPATRADLYAKTNPQPPI